MVSAQDATAAHMNSPKRRQSLPPRVNKSYHYLRVRWVTNLTPFLQPQSAEPLSNVGMVSLDVDDDGESNTSSVTTENILSGMNGGTTSGRSVSNTLHDRSRLMNTSAPSVNGGSTTAGRHQHSHQSQSTRNSASSTSSRHHHHHSSSRRGDGERISSTSSSTSTAKESFLNYFFGQNGPGPVSGANITNMPNEVHGHLNRIGGAVGRDVSGPDPITNAFMRPRNGPTGDGSDAAFDMKSLGRHIEAVSWNPFLPEFRVVGAFRTSSRADPFAPLRSPRWRVMDFGGWERRRPSGSSPIYRSWILPRSPPTITIQLGSCIRDLPDHLYAQMPHNHIPNLDYG